MASRNAPCNSKSQAQAARTCLCSPTTHPGSFRCSLHRNLGSSRVSSGRSAVRVGSDDKWEVATNVAKVNSLKACLLQIIRPSSHDLQRRRDFQPRPSRFCLLNGHRDGIAVS